MLFWRDVLDQEARREEFHRQAEGWQLSQAVQSGQSQPAGRLAASMIRLGAWMERTGCRIQGRFAEIEPAVILTTSGADTQLHGCS
jgi:hypothetical protein